MPHALLPESPVATCALSCFICLIAELWENRGVDEVPFYPLYSFPKAAVTNDHKFSGLKQHTSILLQFGSRNSKTSLTGQKSGCQEGWFPLEAPGRIHFLAFSSFRGLHSFLGLWPLPVFKENHSNLCSHGFTLKKKNYLFLERGEGRKRQRETSMGCLSHAPKWGPSLQPRHVS